MKKKRFHWLAAMINQNKYKIGAEVGAATGNTTKHLLMNCPELEQLFIIDDWRPIPESKQWKRKNLKELFLQKIGGDEKITILEGLSWEKAILVPDGQLDFAFIDASHDKESVLKDLKAWSPKIRKGGMLCGHDLHFPGVVKALEELFEGYERTGIDNTWYIIL